MRAFSLFAVTLGLFFFTGCFSSTDETSETDTSYGESIEMGQNAALNSPESYNGGTPGFADANSSLNDPGGPPTQPGEPPAPPEAPPKVLEPYRTFVSIQKYFVEQNGESEHPISNVRIEVYAPHKKDQEDEPNLFKLPNGQDYWAVEDGQTHEINTVFEVPWEAINPKVDGFLFNIQMKRKGAWYKPCEFKVVALSDFNRKYICRVDEKWQEARGISPENIDRQGIEIRVFTDKNSKKKEIPDQALALK